MCHLIQKITKKRKIVYITQLMSKQIVFLVRQTDTEMVLPQFIETKKKMFI